MEELWKGVPEFPQHRDLSIEDKALLDSAFDRFPPLISEFTFTNLFIWRQAYQIKISRFQEFLILSSEKKGQPFFFPPIGEGNVIRCFRTLLQHRMEDGARTQISRVPEAFISRFDWKAEGFWVEFDRDQSDYVYLTEDLINLQGRRYHRKRNHIKKFKEKYPYQYVPLTTERISECLRLETKWCDLRQCEVIPGLFNESLATKQAFSHFEALGVKGGAILIEDTVEAFTLGEPLNRDTVVIHIEKANPEFEGLYPTINQAFLENHWSGYLHVNREQDLGEEGLRKAKESYFPHHMTNKYTIRLDE